MKIFNSEKIYLVDTIIGLLTVVCVLPIAIMHFFMESVVFSELVPSLVIASLISLFSYRVYCKGRFRLYKATFLNSDKLLIMLIINIIIISGII